MNKCLSIVLILSFVFIGACEQKDKKEVENIAPVDSTIEKVTPTEISSEHKIKTVSLEDMIAADGTTDLYRKLYAFSRKSVMDEIVLHDSLLYAIIPSNEFEYYLFLGVTFGEPGAYDDEPYRIIEDLIYKRSVGGNDTLMSKYMEMSVFVDGYIAESYMDGMGFYAQKDPERFCLCRQKAHPDKVKRLEYFMDWSTGDEVQACN